MKKNDQEKQKETERERERETETEKEDAHDDQVNQSNSSFTLGADPFLTFEGHTLSQVNLHSKATPQIVFPCFLFSQCWS